MSGVARTWTEAKGFGLGSGGQPGFTFSSLRSSVFPSKRDVCQDRKGPRARGPRLGFSWRGITFSLARGGPLLLPSSQGGSDGEVKTGPRLTAVSCWVCFPLGYTQPRPTRSLHLTQRLESSRTATLWPVLFGLCLPSNSLPSPSARRWRPGFQPCALRTATPPCPVLLAAQPPGGCGRTVSRFSRVVSPSRPPERTWNPCLLGCPACSCTFGFAPLCLRGLPPFFSHFPSVKAFRLFSLLLRLSCDLSEDPCWTTVASPVSSWERSRAFPRLRYVLAVLLARQMLKK